MASLKQGSGNSARVSRAARAAARKVGKAIEVVPGPSPNPMTNLMLADLVLRGGGQLLRHTLERTLLGTKYNPAQAREIVKGRSMVQTLIGTAIARIATRSIPGALLVGGGLLAKTLFDRSKGKAAARAEGEKDVAEQIENA